MKHSRFTARGSAIRSGRQPNMGIIGWGLLGAGTAAAGTGGYFAWRNRQLTKVCLGSRDWLTSDGMLTSEATQALTIAIQGAIASGEQNAIAAADTAIIALSMDPDCHLPVVIWGDLLKVRGRSIVLAAQLLEQAGVGAGLEVDATCTKIVGDSEQAATSFGAFLGAQDFLKPGMEWSPSGLTLGVQYFERVAPHCGVGISKSGAPEIIGVDTWQKAAIVGTFALMAITGLQEHGIIDDQEAKEQMLELGEWLRAHDTDLDQLGKVWEAAQTGPGIGGAQTDGTPQGDDWGEPTENAVVDKGTVGGSDGGLWRVYQDNRSEYDRPYYFKVWRKGQYTEIGSYQAIPEAKQAAIDWILEQPKQAGVSGNPNRARVRRRV